MPAANSAILAMAESTTRAPSKAQEPAMLKVSRVYKFFKARASAERGVRAMKVLDDISLDVGRGEFISLLGASGCGKTTLLRIMAGLLRPDRGSVHVNEQPVQAPRRDVCMVFQNLGLLPWRSVLSNAAFPLELDRVTRGKREASAAV